MKKILILATSGINTNYLYNFLNGIANVEFVFFEKKEPKSVFIKRRIKKLGLIKTFDQLLFMATIPKILKLVSKKRIKEIEATYSLENSAISNSNIEYLNSFNEPDNLKRIAGLKVDLIIINGTRILSKNFLSKLTVPVLNIHVGINPKYRGVHGGYWALSRNDKINFGVTLHHVEQGVDTGKVIGQRRIETSKKDNFLTYPVLQYANGLLLLQKYIEGEKDVILDEYLKSELHYHPGLFGYLVRRFCNGVK